MKLKIREVISEKQVPVTELYLKYTGDDRVYLMSEYNGTQQILAEITDRGSLTTYTNRHFSIKHGI